MSFEGIVLLTSILFLAFLLSHDSLPGMGDLVPYPRHRKAHARVEDPQGCRDLRALRQPTDNQVIVLSEEKGYV